MKGLVQDVLKLERDVKGGAIENLLEDILQ